MPKPVAVVTYASPDLVPPFLKPVAVVGTPMACCLIVTITAIASPDLCPAGMVCYGGVNYASPDLVPPFLTKIGNG